MSVRAWMHNPSKKKKGGRSSGKKKKRSPAQIAASKKNLAKGRKKSSGRAKVKRAPAAAGRTVHAPAKKPAKKKAAKKSHAKSGSAPKREGWAKVRHVPAGQCARVSSGKHHKNGKKVRGHWRRTNPTENPMRRRRRRRNPSTPPAVREGLMAFLFGTAAAVVGTLGGFALVKSGITNKWAACAAHAGMGLVAGGGMGMLNPAAGTLVTHNFMLNAANWAMSPGAPATTNSKALKGFGDDYGVDAIDNGDDDVNGILADDMGAFESLGDLAGVYAEDY